MVRSNWGSVAAGRACSDDGLAGEAMASRRAATRSAATKNHGVVERDDVVELVNTGGHVGVRRLPVHSYMYMTCGEASNEGFRSMLEAAERVAGELELRARGSAGVRGLVGVHDRSDGVQVSPEGAVGVSAVAGDVTTVTRAEHGG